MKQAKKNVFLLGVVSFFNDIGSEVIFTILPLYIGSSSVIGLIGGIVSGLGDVTKVYFGYLSDHIGRRRPLVFIGYLISSISKLLIPLIKMPFMLLFLLSDRLGKGIREGPRDAIIALSSRRGWAFGMQKSMDTAGAVVGGLLAYFFISIRSSYTGAMLIAAGIGMFSLLPLLFVSHTHIKKASTGFRKTLKNISGDVKKFAVVGVIFGIVLISPLIFIKEAYDQLGNLGILVYVLFNIVYAVSAQKLGNMSDKYGRRKILNASFIFAAIAFSLMFAGGVGMLIGFLFYGLAMGAFRSTSNALVSDFSKEERATALGLFQTSLGLSIFVGSFAFGVLLDLVGNITFLLGSLASLLSLGAYNFWVN